MNVSIVGLGYVGLPLACLCAKKGHKVKGLELDEQKINSINSVDKRYSMYLGGLFENLKFVKAFADPKKALKDAEIILICVPTPAINGVPDLSYVKNAAYSISKYMSKGCLIIIESTIYPGTIRDVILPILKMSGLKSGIDFFLAHCPERIDPGNDFFSIEKIPRVIGALNEIGLQKSCDFYKSILDAELISMSSVENAEAVKVVENSFRDVNIAFVNELAQSFDKMHLNLVEVINGASTKPFGFMPFYPGPGVGGHCIPQDPYYLIERAKQSGFEHKFLSLAREINKYMPVYSLQKIIDLRNKIENDLGRIEITFLGLTYKPEIDDIRESPSLEVLNLLKEKGVKMKIFDPYFKKLNTHNSLDEALANSNLVILMTPHKLFIKKLTPAFLVKIGVCGIFDARNSLKKDLLIRAGIQYKGIGS